MTPMAASIRHILTDAASSNPDDIWLVTPETEKSFSWQDTRKRAETIACYLQGAGLSKGASVAIAAPNGASASFAFLGVVYGGFRATPLNFCLLYTSPSPRDRTRSRMPSSA